MAYAPIIGIISQYDEQDGWFLKFYKPSTTTPISMSIDSAGTTLLAKCELDQDGFPTTDGTQLFIPFLNQNYDAYLFPSAAEADANDTINAKRVAENINPFGEGFEQEVNYLSIAVTAGQVLLNVPDTPNGLILVIDGDTQEETTDFTYDSANGNITLVVALTGNEQVFVIYGAIVAISGVVVQGKKVFNSLSLASLNPDLVAGDVFDTLGYHSLDDGGSSSYKVVTIQSGLFNQIDFIPLTATGLYAQLIPKNNTVTLAQAGAKFLDEGVAGFDDDALDELISYAITNGVKAIHDGKEAHYYRSHAITESINFEGVGFDSILRCHGDFILLDMSDTSTFYNSCRIGNFLLQSNAAQDDTGMKIHGLFESSVIFDVRVVGFRYGMHLTEQYNSHYSNVYVRQGAQRHYPSGGNDVTPTYGWWLDGSDGQLNAITFTNCGGERNWHNIYIDNSADVGGFVGLWFDGGVCQSAYHSGFVVEGDVSGKANMYFENNWDAANLLSGGTGVLADEGINFTAKGGVDVKRLNWSFDAGTYSQVSANIQNNAPADEIVAFLINADVKDVTYSMTGITSAYNDASKVDWNCKIEGGSTSLFYEFGTFDSGGKGSANNIYVGSSYNKNVMFSLFGLDNTTDLSSEPLLSLVNTNQTLFASFIPTVTATFTTAPVYVLQDRDGVNYGTMALPLSVTKDVEVLLKLTGLPIDVLRFARSVSAVGDNPNFTVSLFQKEVGFRTLVTYVE